jgi:hypothetical protein
MPLPSCAEVVREEQPMDSRSSDSALDQRCAGGIDPRGYFSLLLRVAVQGTMIPRRMARRNDVSQSIVLTP